jgi:hypothetical protein
MGTKSYRPMQTTIAVQNISSTQMRNEYETHV